MTLQLMTAVVTEHLKISIKFIEYCAHFIRENQTQSIGWHYAIRPIRQKTFQVKIVCVL